MQGFHPQDIVTGADFLDREEETKALLNRLRHGQNTLIVAPRRFGKSSLIQETFRRLEREATCLYVDLFSTTSEREAAEAIMSALLAKTASRVKRLRTWLTETLANMGVTIRHAPTGIEVVFESPRKERDDLVDVLRTLERFGDKRGSPVYIALDEFQRVLDWKGGRDTIAAMRSVIQQQRKTTYIFSGSKKHVLLGLVEDPGQPFWQQLDVLEPAGISVTDFAEYAKKRFRVHGKTLEDDALERISLWCRDNPKRIQELLQGVLMDDEAPTPKVVDRIALKQIQSQQHLLRSLLDQLGAVNQIRLLKALAREPDEASAKIYSIGFIQRSRLGSGANVQSAYNALRDAGFLDADHRFTDPYLKMHLAPRRPGEQG